MFKKVSPKPNFKKLEKGILEYWEKNKIFEKSLRKGQGKQQGSSSLSLRSDYGANGFRSGDLNQQFVFYEGPPTANGRPGVHHIEARAFKDLFPRYKTMRGYRVIRKAGWDTHGLPVELEVEKNLGFSGKKDIEKYGIARFNQKCAQSVWKYKKEWEEMTRRIGFWLDLKNPYITCSNDYIESVWWIVKKVWEKGLLYQGHKVVPYCPRCGTALSSHEVAQGYKKVTEESVFIKFPIVIASVAECKRGEAKQSPLMRLLRSLPLPRNDRRGVFFLAWTTTPWTLPGNVALALGKDIDYVLVEIKGDNKAPQPRFARTMEPTGKIDNCRGLIYQTQGRDKSRPYKEYLILAKDRIEVIKGKYKVIKEFKGKDLEGIDYEPLYPVFSEEKKKNPRIYQTALADFVTTAEGTGIVHTAVMYGEDDYELGKKLGLPMRHTVNEQGKFQVQSSKFKVQSCSSKLKIFQRINNRFVKDAEKDIIQDLKKRGLLYKSEMYSHDYPFCWRCKTPLLYYAKKSWFIKMSALREKLEENNEKINWIPAYLKQGRFGKWLAEVKDWAVSRERYWGTPLPIWQCQIGKSQIPNPKSQTNSKFPKGVRQGGPYGAGKIQNSKKHCGRIEVIGSVGELEALSGKKIQNFHRPYIDEVIFRCEKCGGEMKRVPEVLDCWFDSGAMPFAQNHWPFADAQVQSSKFPEGEQAPYGAGKVQSLKPPRLFPADFICEAVDQTRGWFYTLLAISTLLGFGTPYKNVISLGHILDAKGRKMSKSRGNIVDPFKALDQFGADALRWFFYSVNKPQESKNFDPQVLREIISRFILTLWNSYAFFVTYANIDKLKLGRLGCLGKWGRLGVLDRWIMSRFNGLNKNIVQHLDNYNVRQAAKEIEKFVDDLSNWYIRRSRRRFWKSENDQDKKEGYATLYFVLVNLAKILAPFTPFLAEEIYRNLTGEESVHLSKFPQVSEKHLDYNLEKQMEMVRKIVTIGLNLRAQAGIKVRQPLKKFKVQSSPKESKLPTGQAKFKVINQNLLALVQEEVNVKEISFAGKVREKKDWLVAEEGDIKVSLNIKITPTLKYEGMARDLVRLVQEARKKAGFEVTDRIELGIETQDPEIKKAIKEWAEYIKKETLTQKLEEKAKEEGYQEKVKIGEGEVRIEIKKVQNSKFKIQS